MPEMVHTTLPSIAKIETELHFIKLSKVIQQWRVMKDYCKKFLLLYNSWNSVKTCHGQVWTCSDYVLPDAPPYQLYSLGPGRDRETNITWTSSGLSQYCVVIKPVRNPWRMFKMKILEFVPRFSVQLSHVPNPLPCAAPGLSTTSSPPAPASTQLSACHSYGYGLVGSKNSTSCGTFDQRFGIVCMRFHAVNSWN